MGLARLRQFLGQHRRIALDSCIFIYQLEANPRYVALTDELFRWLDGDGAAAVTSTLTMTEVLVKPYRAGADAVWQSVYVLLSAYPHLEWIAPELDVCDRAACLRAQYGLRTPDAVQLATAFHAGATAFVTNDKALRRVADIEVAVLDELIK